MRPHVLVLPLALLLAACSVDPQSGSTRPVTSGLDAAGDVQEASLPPDGISEPARLKGLNSRQITAFLGQPSFTRKDSPAEIWQYRVKVCTLDLFLYEEGPLLRVAHFAVRSPQAISDQACFDEVLTSLRGKPVS